MVAQLQMRVAERPQHMATLVYRSRTCVQTLSLTKMSCISNLSTILNSPAGRCQQQRPAGSEQLQLQLEQLQQTEQLQLELLVSLLLIYDLRCMCASIRPILCRSLAAAAEADVAAAARTTVDARVADAAVLLCVALSTAACWPRARLQARQRRRPRGSRAPSRGQVNPPSPPLYISFAILHTKQTGGDG